MAADSKIEWTHHTWNPVRGCAKISPGCQHCYAAELARVNPNTLGTWGTTGIRAISGPDADLWKLPARWNRAAERAGEGRRVFVNSMWDPFETLDGIRPRADYLPVLERMREIFAPLRHLRPIVLTKRADVMARWARECGWPETWWAGVSVENQAAADARIEHLRRVPARVRFLSMEPLLGPVDLGGHVEPTAFWRAAAAIRRGRYPVSGDGGHRRIDWVIVGGESGPRARPMHPEWARSLRDQCVAAGVPFFFKQWGEWAPEPSAVTEGDFVFPDGRHMTRIGKTAAGRILDRREWSEVPDAG